MDVNSLFNGRSIVIATQHKKELVIAPILEKQLGVRCILPSQLDTDQFGTFTGEVDRKDDPVTTARKKCQQAMALTNCDMAIASEGSFGPHPAFYFIPADDEILLFQDQKHQLEIVARELSTETNFYGTAVATEEALIQFAEKALFPSHALILRKSKDDFAGIQKGITNWTRLKEVFNSLCEQYGSAFAETDMRALYNPTRMNVIETVTQKLVTKIKTLCPNCQSPGFDIHESLAGLPCALCGNPTRSLLSHLYVCKKCNYREEKKYPADKHREDPRYCDHCNP